MPSFGPDVGAEQLDIVEAMSDRSEIPSLVLLLAILDRELGLDLLLPDLLHLLQDRARILPDFAHAVFERAQAAQAFGHPLRLERGQPVEDLGQHLDRGPERLS